VDSGDRRAGEDDDDAVKGELRDTRKRMAG
jgi:hypothetical protein